MISQFEKRAATAEPIGGTLKFEVDGSRYFDRRYW